MIAVQFLNSYHIYYKYNTDATQMGVFMKELNFEKNIENTFLNPEAFTDRIPNLKIQNSPSKTLQFYELESPFMIILETCDEASGLISFYEFTMQGYSSNSAKGLPLEQVNGRVQHQHAFIEIMFVLSGSVINHIGAETFVYGPGQCCIMNRNIRHCEEFTGTYQAVFFMLKDEFLLKLYDEYQQENLALGHTANTLPIFELLLDSQREKSRFSKVYLDFLPVVSTEDIFALTTPVFNLLIEELSDVKPGSFFFIKGIFARLFHCICSPEFYCMNRVASDLNHQDYIFSKITHLLEASQGRCTREALAHQLNYNDEYLNRIVKKYTGKTILEYGRDIYMEEAKRLLLETSLSISTIVSKLGFSNRSHFYRIFKHFFGETPLEYRKNHASLSSAK